MERDAQPEPPSFRAGSSQPRIRGWHRGSNGTKCQALSPETGSEPPEVTPPSNVWGGLSTVPLPEVRSGNVGIRPVNNAPIPRLSVPLLPQCRLLISKVWGRADLVTLPVAGCDVGAAARPDHTVAGEQVLIRSDGPNFLTEDGKTLN